MDSSLGAFLASIQASRGEDLAQVLALLERARHAARLPEGRAAHTTALTQVWALVLVEADDRALEVVEELAAQARRSGALIGALTIVGCRGWLHARRGELAAAEAEIRPGLDVSLQNGWSFNAATCFWFLRDALLECPSLGDVAALVESFELEPALMATWGGAMLLEARGPLRLQRGDREGAVADLRACAATNAALGRGPTYTPWRSALALALPAQARDEALALVDEELALAAASGLARPHGVALRAAGRDGVDGLACLHESVALLEDSPARLEHARSLVELGAALRRRGRRAQAREPLAAGIELAHRCGAERLVAHAGEELRAAGARPRRIVRSGLDALTPSEQRVAGSRPGASRTGRSPRSSSSA